MILENGQSAKKQAVQKPEKKFASAVDVITVRRKKLKQQDMIMKQS